MGNVDKNLVVYYVYFHNSSCGEYIKLSQGRGGYFS